jgi:hypothetical protein
VYFVRHNGGAVWFDQLGDPWWKHACFDDSEPKKPAKRSKRWITLKRIETTDLGQKIVFVSCDDETGALYPAPDFWKRQPQPQPGDRFLVDWETLMFEFNDLTSCRFWTVTASQCPFCEKYNLAYRFHKERCANRKKTKSGEIAS